MIQVTFSEVGELIFEIDLVAVDTERYSTEDLVY
jgi:hypothetical protein